MLRRRVKTSAESVSRKFRLHSHLKASPCKKTEHQCRECELSVLRELLLDDTLLSLQLIGSRLKLFSSIPRNNTPRQDNDLDHEQMSRMFFKRMATSFDGRPLQRLPRTPALSRAKEGEISLFARRVASHFLLT